MRWEKGGQWSGRVRRMVGGQGARKVGRRRRGYDRWVLRIANETKVSVYK
jgi:hypothetical protein